MELKFDKWSTLACDVFHFLFFQAKARVFLRDEFVLHFFPKIVIYVLLQKHDFLNTLEMFSSDKLPVSFPPILFLSNLGYLYS